MRWPVLITVCTLASMPCATALGQPADEPPRSPIVVEVRDDGFDWADAGIGGAAVLGLVLAGTGAALITRRPQDPARTPRHQKGAAMQGKPASDKQPDPDSSGSHGPSLQRRRP